MPELPTFTVTDAQAQRLLNAFGSVENYLNWLRDMVVAYVVDAEISADRVAFNQALEEKRQQIIDSLTT